MDAQTLLWFVLIPLAVVLLVRKLTASNPPPKPAATNKKKPAGMGKTAKKEPRAYTTSEVAKHNSRDDCWLIIDGKVYDVTPYVELHMGGDAILNNAGADSSKGFHGEQHPDKVAQILPEYYIGWLEDKAN